MDVMRLFLGVAKAESHGLEPEKVPLMRPALPGSPRSIEESVQRAQRRVDRHPIRVICRLECLSTTAWGRCATLRGASTEIQFVMILKKSLQSQSQTLYF